MESDDLKNTGEVLEANIRRENSYINFISHEIRSRINAITGFSQLIAEADQSDEDRKKFAKIIKECSDDLVLIINNIWEISNIETGGIKIAENEVDLHQVCTDISEKFKEEAFHKKLIFKSEEDVEATDSIVLSDKERLVQIIATLLINSFQNTFTGSIVFGYFLRKGFIEFFITDTGIGIPEKDKPEIFNKFYKTGNSVLKTSSGAGLGLTFCKSLIERMGGEIWFTSTEGSGSDFRFTIPHKRAQIPQVAEPIHDSGVSVQKNRQKVVLVAEDDNLNYTLIKNFLSKLDIILIRAENGQAAVDLCNSNNIDLVLMDIRMPEMDGFTATRIIKSTKPDLQIIAQTAFTHDRETALANGCNDFIAKPFGREQLVTLVNSYL